MTPKLPSVRELARELRKEPGGIVGLCVSCPKPHLWIPLPKEGVYGCETIPSERATYDAHAAARRLISDARSSMKGMR